MTYLPQYSLYGKRNIKTSFKLNMHVVYQHSVSAVSHISTLIKFDSINWISCHETHSHFISLLMHSCSILIKERLISRLCNNTSARNVTRLMPTAQPSHPRIPSCNFCKKKKFFKKGNDAASFGKVMVIEK